MVRNYIRKTTKGADGSRYTKLDLENAIRDVRNNIRRLNTAAKYYNVPRTTLRHYVEGTRGKGLSAKRGKGGGGKLAIPLEDENKLAECLIAMEKWGFGLSRNELLDVVQNYVINNNLKTKFKDGRPKEDWFLSFKKRHNLSLKKPQGIEFVRIDQHNPFTINGFYDILTETIEKLQLTHRPDLIFNLDETSFSSDPSKTKVVGLKGTKSTRMISSAGRENTSVLFCCSALGQKLPPLVIFKGKNIIESWINENDRYETTYAASKRGWMDSEIFYNWFEKVFLRYIPKYTNSLLIFDGHASHVNYKLAKCANEHNVTILKLPPHLTHLLQPLDVCVFKPFKNSWDKEIVKWQRQNPRRRIPKKEFVILLNKVYHNLDETIIIKGFKKTGIYDKELVVLKGCSVNRKAVPDTIFKPSDLSRYLQSKEGTAGENHIIPHVTSETEISEIAENNEPPEKLSRSENYFATTQSKSHQKLSENINKNAHESKKSSADVLVLSVGNATPSQYQINQNPSEPEKNIAEKEYGKKSFEDILLNLVGENKKGSAQTTKRRRVCTGAEVITSKQSLERLKITEESKKSKAQLNGSRKQTKNGNVNSKENRKKKKITKGKKRQMSSSSESEEEIEKLTVDTSDENADEIADISDDDYQPHSNLLPSTNKELPLQEIENIDSNIYLEESGTSPNIMEQATFNEDGEINNKPISDSDEENIPLSAFDSRGVTWGSIQEDMFLLVSFSGYKKKTYKYVCLVKSKEDNNEISVIGCRSVDSNKQEFKINMSDVSYITINMVTKILPTPQTIFKGRQMLYRFSFYVPVCEK